ncbi:hypoxanthine phosphoribosyltransferase [Pseudobacter ginsenosidimutans]|uniref:Hypoxanthine phosphoribosyltransferase n=1 Tax=Pseudobacter ginsenosidimutans TaxID=661488 RepID=A0A4Q7MV72_9BACT|nr:hypoxanthine phosphoribosyltransferase [Pseudobacter ginsenosidimutans]QEC40782.1 hypoxanthine phosphoribosyltransferase [Pseudobacter ginsenosidimutans]RZS72488.1 hypoxanthine phosphoribosyltransferase [Pseudobacter ginsenosidimutans]
MSIIRVHDKSFEPYLTADVIKNRIREIAADLNRDYAGKRPVFIAILNGSFIFAADLFKELSVDVEVCFIKLASYKGTRSTGQVLTAIGLDTDIFERDVVVIEDIVDTGKTLSEFLPQLHHQQPSSLKIVALLHKPEATVFPIPIDYIGFAIPNKFVVGYGLDYDGLGRNIPEIYKLAE